MESKDINLDEIRQMPEMQFKQHFYEWIENDGVARALQAKLRKDLIDTFNKTNLGRKLYAQSYGLMLSPLILALNTLVAEFLYVQNCHFSLSVFSTEVPYRNTLPDFESVAIFRFSESEIVEIFEAISGNIQEDMQKDIIKQYLETSDKTGSSLLYLILKYLLKKHEDKPQVVVTEPIKNGFERKTNHKNNVSNSNNARENSRHKFFDNHLRYLNKYLVLLSRKVTEMAYSLESIKRREENSENIHKKSVQSHKLEQVNRSLQKISENLKNLSLSKRKSKEISAIIKALDSIANQFEKCALNFENVYKTIYESKGEKVKKEKSYLEWIDELRNTKSGRKFISKIEASLRKSLEREKEKMAQIFETKLENEKELIKLKYKQKLLEQIEKRSLKEETENSKAANNIIEQKLKDLDLKHQELLKRVTESEDRIRKSPTPVNITKELGLVPETEKLAGSKPESSIRNKVEKANQMPDLDDESIKKIEKAEKTLNVQLQLEQMAKNIAQQERDIDRIVYDAKLRIQELEHESNQLHQSFEEYLKRQKHEKNEMKENVNSIWERYKIEKTILNKKYTNTKTMRNHNTVHNKSDIRLQEIISTLPTIEIVPEELDFESMKHIPVFENPFKKLQDEMLIKSLENFEKIPNVRKDFQVLEKSINSGDMLKIDSRKNIKSISRQDSIKTTPQSQSNVHHVITHESKSNNNEKLQLMEKTKQPKDNIAFGQKSIFSSEVHKKDTKVDPLEISPSKSTNKMYSSSLKKAFRCRRNIFSTLQDNTCTENQEDVEKSKYTEQNVTDLKETATHSIVEGNIFTNSDRSTKSSKDTIDEFVKSEHVESKLTVPSLSARDLSSSNSTPRSLRLSLSIGRPEISGNDI